MEDTTILTPPTTPRAAQTTAQADLTPSTTSLPDSPIAPFISLLDANDMDVEKISEWLGKICLEHEGVNSATDGKAAEIWNTRLSKFFESVLAKDRQPLALIWLKSNGSLDPISVKWLDNPAVDVTDAWTAIAFIMSVAASYDTSQHAGEPDWHVELLIVFANMLRVISERRIDEIGLPNVVHILWTKDNQALLQTSCEPAGSSSGTSSTPSTPAPTQPVQLPNLDDTESGGSSTAQATARRSQAPAQSSFEAFGKNKPPFSSLPQRPTSASGQVMGSTGPSSPSYKILKEYRQNKIDQALYDLDPSVRDEVMETVNQIRKHSETDNLGKCAETFPYLCIVSGGLNPRDIYGLACRARNVNVMKAEDLLKPNPDPAQILRSLHESGFERACRICCALMQGIKVQYIQYIREDGEPRMLHPGERMKRKRKKNYPHNPTATTS